MMMKVISLASLIALTAYTGFAQGTVRFDNNIPGVLVTHVYFGSDDPGPYRGNGVTDYPGGTRDWTGFQLAEGSTFSAQLFAAPGENNWLNLKPASPITTFQTGQNAGFVFPLIATLQGVPADAPAATVALMAWDNQNGLVDTYEKASTLWGVPVSQFGQSTSFNVYKIGGVANEPPVLQGLQSFSLWRLVAVPEPSHLSLLGAGVLTFLRMRYRSKRG